MNILDTIIECKKGEVARNKKLVSLYELQQQEHFNRQVISLKSFLLDESKTGIIAEFKRRSPSKGIINDKSDVLDVTTAYIKYGASGLSVLTDTEFFGGSADDLLKARLNEIPILRKDFIIDEYQLAEARAMGADVILLIAACLTPHRVQELAFFAKSLKLEVLLEIHNEAELQHICDEVDLVGVNNRDLKTFSVDINRSIELSRQIPADKIKIAESGIDNAGTINIFKQAGFKGFLMGEHFMKSEDPGKAFEQFVKKLKQG
ncbi:MAG: indole-3-glycerol phosphate synthase TrpC [Ferruginibacter sp.]|nr:indole-3-glycerol phosphate synthase TrpC [Chitinophagaceae bacterium]